MQSQLPNPGVLGSNSGSGIFNQYNYSPPAPDHSGEFSEVEGELYRRVATAAIHNSADQGADAPRCHPQTREAVQSDIHSHLSHPGAQGGHIWLTGPAGAGKTAIIGSVCDKLQEEGRLAATFYFSSHKNSKNRKSKRDFVTTLAHQLRVHAGFGDHISTRMLTALRNHRTIFDMTLNQQAGALILKPFREAVDLPTEWTLAVDGIDECEDDYDTSGQSRRQSDQLEVLRVLLALVNDRSFPCRIIIASRPEEWIREFFEVEAKDIFKEIFLGDNYDPGADILLYYKSRFSSISRRRRYTVEWPKEHELRKLVDDASGQFVYAETVIRFVDSDAPKEMLTLVLGVKSRADGVDSPFMTLDELYAAIIWRCSRHRTDTTIRWLHVIRLVIGIQLQTGELSMPLSAFVNSLLESEKDEARDILAIPSLVDPEYRFYHKSFIDYLQDRDRSGKEFPNVDRENVKQWLAERISKILEIGCPEVRPSSPDHAHHQFREDLKVVWYELMRMWNCFPAIPQDALAKSDPAIWLPRHSANTTTSRSSAARSSVAAGEDGLHREPPYSPVEAIYVLVHSEVSKLP